MQTLSLILSTFPNIASARVAVHTLLEERLAACGNIAPGFESIYTWNGLVKNSKEVLVIFKTTSECSEAAMQRLSALHPYEVPEIISLPVESAWSPYLDWVSEHVGAATP